MLIRNVLASAMAVLCSLSGQAGATEKDAPFNALLGTWGGRGQIRMEGGQTERISCNAYYSGGGAQLGMAIRCASPSYSIEMRSRLNYARGRITGRWEERTFNAEGDISGQATDEKITLDITGGISGSMSVSYNPHQQTVALSTEGIALKSVSISLSRK